MRRACWWLAASGWLVALWALWALWSLLHEVSRGGGSHNGWREAIQDDEVGPVARFYGAADPWDQDGGRS